MRLGEPFAAGYFEEPDAAPMRRWSRAVRRRLEHESPPPYIGTWLYPYGDLCQGQQRKLLEPSYSFTWLYNDRITAQRIESAEGNEKETLLVFRRAMQEERALLHEWRTIHRVGGAGYTHSIPNYGRVLRDGLDAHARRIEAGLDKAARQGAHDRADCYLGLQDVLRGIDAWRVSLLHALESWPGGDAEAERRRDALLQALMHVPFGSARNFHEAFVAYNLTYYLDGCDNPGRIDQELQPYYETDLREGRLSRAEALAMMREFTENVCAAPGWSAAIGGTTSEGAPGYNELTLLCLESVQGKYRPNYELRVRKDMPDEVWDAALTALGTGCGQPALYNEEGYLDGLREMDLGLTDEDVTWWNGGGCTETMIHGRSNVGSLDAGLHLPLVLEGTLKTSLKDACCFEALLGRFRADVAAAVVEIVENVNHDQETRARRRPQPMRTLLIDDCIDRGIEFNAGGARYNWSVINVAGLANVADSLAAIREMVFDKREVAGDAFLRILEEDYRGNEPLRRRAAQCPRFGNDDMRADNLAASIARFVFREFDRHRPWRGGRFLPSCIMFETYGAEGERLGATPDGRRAGEPLADSIGPYQGRDTQGPTAMVRSVTRLPLAQAIGTPIVNVRLSKDLFASAEGCGRVREFIQTYFDLGGMQIQVSVVDQTTLLDAMEHPERHEDLIVRIGGYSAYFNNLSPSLKEAVLHRTIHGA